MVALFNEFKSVKKTEKKENPIMLRLNRKKKTVLKENGKKKCTNCKNIFCFLMSLKTIMFQKIFKKQFEYGKKNQILLKKIKLLFRLVIRRFTRLLLTVKGLR